MIIITLIMCYATFSHGRGLVFSNILAVSLVSLALFIGVYYHILQDPSFHQTAYAILTAIVLFRSMFIMETRLRPALVGREKNRVMSNGAAGANVPNGIGATGPRKVIDELARTDVRELSDKFIIKRMWQLVGLGLAIFLGGYAIWNLDNELCGSITRMRREIGMPWGFLLEGHGWW